MPTYDYVCDACEHAFEEFQSISAKPLKKCPACGRSRLKRLIGVGAGIIFKGSGFYETDYRSDSYKEAAKKDSEAAKPATETKTSDAKPAESAAKPKSESKPAKKTDTKTKAAAK
jgi:putative FmdB family regulatory protein